MNTSHDKIELRSKKIRNLIGEMPKGIIRYGTYVIVLIFAIIFALFAYISANKSDGKSILESFLDI